MISVWGVDHGEEITKMSVGVKLLSAGALGGAAAGAGGYEIMRRSDKKFEGQARTQRGKLSGITAGSAGVAGLLVGGPLAGLGAAAGAGGTMYYRARKKKP